MNYSFLQTIMSATSGHSDTALAWPGHNWIGARFLCVPDCVAEGEDSNPRHRFRYSGFKMYPFSPPTAAGRLTAKGLRWAAVVRYFGCVSGLPHL